MENLLTKIIEMDENARKIREQSELEKINSQNEIEEMRDAIYNDFIDRANDRVEKNIAIDRENADKKLAEYSENAERLKEAMRKRYNELSDSWVDEIVSRVIQ